MISITLTEAMAKMRPTDFKLAAVLARQLADKCLLMGEDGRGIAALARAKKARDQLDSGSVTDHLWTVFVSSEAQLQRASGDAAGAIASLDKAIALLRPVATSFERRGGDDVDVALYFAQYLKQLAGSREQAGLPAEALGTYAESRHYLQRIIHYVEHHLDEFPGDSGRSYLLNQARYVLGGVLANEATILKSSARVLDEIAAELPHLAFGELLFFASGSQDGMDRQTGCHPKIR